MYLVAPGPTSGGRFMYPRTGNGGYCCLLYLTTRKDRTRGRKKAANRAGGGGLKCQASGEGQLVGGPGNHRGGGASLLPWWGPWWVGASGRGQLWWGRPYRQYPVWNGLKLNSCAQTPSQSQTSTFFVVWVFSLFSSFSRIRGGGDLSATTITDFWILVFISGPLPSHHKLSFHALKFP